MGISVRGCLEGRATEDFAIKLRQSRRRRISRVPYGPYADPWKAEHVQLRGLAVGRKEKAAGIHVILLCLRRGAR